MRAGPEREMSAMDHTPLRRLRRHPALILLLLLMGGMVLGLPACVDTPTEPVEDDPTDDDDPPAPNPWLVANGNPLSSLTSSDFTDLQFLKDVIGDRRIVQLGESSHGVAEFSQAKVRLVQFLHQEMGFEVVAFESSLYECFQANRRVESLSGEDLMFNCLYGVWYTEEVVPLFDFIRDTQSGGTPLRFAGFDIKASSFDGIQGRPDFMADVVAEVDQVYAAEVKETEVDMSRPRL